MRWIADTPQVWVVNQNARKTRSTGLVYVVYTNTEKHLRCGFDWNIYFFLFSTHLRSLVTYKLVYLILFHEN